MRISSRSCVLGLSAFMACLLLSGPLRASDLLKLYTQATEYDTTFQVARYERDIADEALRESRAGRRPTINANIDASKVYQDIQSSDNFLYSEGKSDYFNDNYSISLTQPIYRVDLNMRVPQAKAQVTQAVAVFAAAEQDLAYRVAEALFVLLASRDNLDFATAERTAIQQQLEETQQRLSAGLSTLTDLHDARARFALAQTAEISATDALEASRQALADITGELPSELKSLSDTFPLVEPDRADVEAWVTAALFQNPEIKAREAAVEISRREIRLQHGAHMPTVDLVSSWANRDSGGTELGGGGGLEIASTNISLRVGIPIYDGGRKSALTHSAELRHRIALQQLEAESRRIERETRAAFRGVMSGITRVEALSKSVLSYEAALVRRREELRSGLSTLREVLDATRDQFLAKRDLTRARYEYILNGLKLKQSSGILGIEDLVQINAHLQ